MMQLAERETVPDCRLPEWIGIRNNVRRVEKLSVPETTQCALLTIRRQNPLPESGLMQSHLYS